jgi:antirestriction protein ArdC
MKTKPTAKKAKKKSTTTVYQIVTDQIIASLKQGTIPWRKPWSTAHGTPRSYDGRRYKGINVLLTLIACWQNNWKQPVFITRKKAEALGGGIVKGSKYTAVTLWLRFIPEEYKSNPEDCPRNEVRWSLRYYRVYNLAQTEGLPALPEISGPAEDFSPIDECETLVYDMETPPKIEETNGIRAFYSPKLDQITMPPASSFESPAFYYATLFHELSHSTGHESRLDRFKEDSFDRKGSSYAKEELIAEIGSSFLRAHTGIEAPDLAENTTAYIQNWIARLQDDPKLIMNAAKAAEKSTELILGPIA